MATRGWACEGLDAEGVLKKLQAKDANVIKEFKVALRVKRGESTLPNEVVQAGQKIGLKLFAEVGVLFSDPFLEKYEVNLTDVPRMPIANKLLGPSGSQSERDLVTLLIFKAEDVDKVRSLGLPAHRAEVFSEVFNILLENKMEAPLRAQQGRLTFSRINAATWKDRDPAMQFNELSLPKSWDDCMTILQEHQRGLADQADEPENQNDDEEESEEEPKAIDLLGASTVGIGAKVVKKKKKKKLPKGKAKGKAAAKRGSAGGRDSKASSYRSPAKTNRGSDDALMSSSKRSGAGGGGGSGSARVSVECEINDQGQPVWKTVDANKLASGEEEIDKRLNGA